MFGLGSSGEVAPIQWVKKDDALDSLRRQRKRIEERQRQGKIEMSNVSTLLQQRLGSQSNLINSTFRSPNLSPVNSSDVSRLQNLSIFSAQKNADTQLKAQQQIIDAQRAAERERQLLSLLQTGVTSATQILQAREEAKKAKALAKFQPQITTFSPISEEPQEPISFGWFLFGGVLFLIGGFVIATRQEEKRVVRTAPVGGRWESLIEQQKRKKEAEESEIQAKRALEREKQLFEAITA